MKTVSRAVAAVGRTGAALRTRVRRHLAQGRQDLEQRWRGWAAAAAGLAGLAALTFGPAWLVVFWNERTTQQQEQVRGPHQVGDEVPAGPVTFVVHELRCGPDDKSDNGRRCELILGVRNDGSDEVTVPGSAQTLHVSEGARHLPAPTDSPPFGTLAPDEAAAAVLTYDLPLAVTVTHLELRPGPYDHGRPVPVTNPYPLVTPG